MKAGYDESTKLDNRRYTMQYQYIYSVAVTLIAMTFILSAINGLKNWQNTVAMMQAKGMPQADLLLKLTTILKFVAGTMLITHFHADLAAAGLLIFTVLATLIFNNFWKEAGMQRQMLYFGFLSNLSIIGGLALVLAIG